LDYRRSIPDRHKGLTMDDLIAELHHLDERLGDLLVRL
jgi:hypothetical protein